MKGLAFESLHISNPPPLNKKKVLVPINYGKRRTLAPLPSAKPLAPIGRSHSSGMPPKGPVIERCETPARGHNLDSLMAHLDVAVVADLIERSTALVQDLQGWWTEGSNSIAFTHFWLTEFPDDQRIKLLTLEMELLEVELRGAFAGGFDAGAVNDVHIRKLIRATLREYPDDFSSGDGTGFIDLVRVVASGKKDAYRQLLSAVHASTENAQFGQWLLAIRSFSMITMISSVTTFFRRAAEECEAQSTTITSPSRPQSASRPQSTGGSLPSSESAAEAFTAAKLGHDDVLYYLLSRGIIAPNMVDGLGRTLLFVAVAHNQPTVVELLLANTGQIDVGTVAHSGNTALHAAAAYGNARLVQALLEAGADAACKNLVSGATPGDVAEMHGHDAVIQALKSHHRENPG